MLTPAKQSLKTKIEYIKQSLETDVENSKTVL